MKKYTKKSKAQENRNEFPKGKCMIELVKKDCYYELQVLVERLRQWLIDGENANWKTIKRIDIDYSKIKYLRRCKDDTKITKDQFFDPIVEFLLCIDSAKGLNVELEAFIRYLSSSKHSNFGIKYSALRTKIHRKLAYLRSRQNDGST